MWDFMSFIDLTTTKDIIQILLNIVNILVAIKVLTKKDKNNVQCTNITSKNTKGKKNKKK